MKRDKNDKFPVWIKTTPGTLVLRKPSTERLKFKQKYSCPVSVLGRFAISDFKLVDPGKGEYEVTEKIIEKSVADAKKSLLKSGKDGAPKRKFVKLSGVVNSDPVVGKNLKAPKVKGDDKYDVVHRGGGKWVVQSETGKRMHGDYLTKDAAKALKKQLKG